MPHLKLVQCDCGVIIFGGGGGGTKKVQTNSLGTNVTFCLNSLYTLFYLSQPANTRGSNLDTLLLGGHEESLNKIKK